MLLVCVRFNLVSLPTRVTVAPEMTAPDSIGHGSGDSSERLLGMRRGHQDERHCRAINRPAIQNAQYAYSFFIPSPKSCNRSY